MTQKDNREKAIEATVSQIERQFGKGAIMRLGSDEAIPGIPVISSGALPLDVALGVGGIPRGRVTEIYGPESSGKTTLTLHVIAQAQKHGGVAAFIDAEHALDIGYARKLGVRTDDLLVSQPDTGEQALEITEMLLRSGAMDIIVIDSVAALVASLGDQGVDILINNAGTPGPAPEQQTALNMDFDGWLEAFNVNSVAPLRVLQALHPLLKKGTDAKAITITSQMGALDLNWPTMYAYCSSKAAVNKVMRMISLELASDNIAVGLIHPGWVQTDMGGAQADITATESAAGIISVIEETNIENTGSFKKWNGETHAW